MESPDHVSLIRLISSGLVLKTPIMYCISCRGVAGGVVSQNAFQVHFHLVDEFGVPNQHRVDNVSGNIVSVLQAGAFFGALGSAPISGEFNTFVSDESVLKLFRSTDWSQIHIACVLNYFYRRRSEYCRLQLVSARVL